MKKLQNTLLRVKLMAAKLTINYRTDPAFLLQKEKSRTADKMSIPDSKCPVCGHNRTSAKHKKARPECGKIMKARIQQELMINA
jgi:ribosomal protein S27AE